MKPISLMAGLALAAAVTTVSAEPTLLLRQPALSADHMAFVYAGDIWVADRDGRNPRRLTSSPVEENSPSFSPDGSMIAFAARHEDNRDAWVVPVSGGQPQRLTWHPAADVPTGWTPDGGAVTVISDRETDHGRSGQLYHAALAGGLPAKRMEARVYRGVWDSSGQRFAYIAHGSGYNGLFGGTSGWKGYRGGTTPAVQIMDTRAGTVTAVPGPRSTNFNPLWLDDALYFISDRDDKQFNLYRYDPAAGGVEKVTDERTWDVHSAGGHGRTVIYEAGGRLKRLDLATGDVDELAIELNPDLPQLRPQWKDASKTVQHAAISPTGKRAVITARGEVFTVPTDEGSTRNVSQSGGTREYTAIWSPDGQQIAWIEDALDGQTLVVEDQTGMGEARRYRLGPHFYELKDWAVGEPGRIVFEDNHLGLHAIELGRGAIRRIATGARREDVDAALSPDGRWLAYTQERPNFHRDLMLTDLVSGTVIRVTDGTADVAAPAFSRDGNYLYFAASTNSGPLQVGLNMTSRERPYRAGLYALVLLADGESPLLPGSGDEDEATAEESNGEEESPTPAETRIDGDGLGERIVALPVAEANYRNLGVAEDGMLYYVDAVQPGASREPPGEDEGDGNRLMRFDFDEREAEAVLTGIGGFALSADGKHLLVEKTDGSLAVAEIGEDIEPEALDLGGLRLRVNPREEWAQIFDETWRMEQEYFYDPNMHGLDWQAVYDRYRPLLDHVGRREDLADLLVEMIAEMQVGHNRTGGGDVHREEGANTGLLGANLTVENGRYRLARVYTGESWNPFIAAPLAVPGNEARDGEYILAVDGRPLTGDDNIWAFLQGTAGKQVTLRVGPQPDGRNARDIVIEPVTSETQLRLWHWIETNRRYVDEATGGRVGYVYLPNTADAGYTFFNRMFFAQVHREAVIIDERSNGGGQAANYITEVLSRRHLSGWKDRDGQTFNTPAGAVHGPKVMLIDQDAGSGGDYLPYAFRHLGIGTLIGTRTWGGLIGIAHNPDQVDGGDLVVPFFRFFDPEGNWSIENEGVAPDLEVALDPILYNAGRDSQLEFAVREILDQVEDYRDSIPDGAPPYPTELAE